MHKWKRMAAVAAISFAVLCLLAVNVFTQENLPKFYVKEKKVSVGEVLEGEDVVYDFIIKNMGSAELQILNVRPG